MECTNQGVNDSHSAGIRSPFNQDEGRACRERQRRMIPLSHAKWCVPGPGQRDLNVRRVRLFRFAVNLLRQVFRPLISTRTQFRGAAKWTTGSGGSDSAAASASHPTPFLDKCVLFTG